jgi:hypothetical protein
LLIIASFRLPFSAFLDAGEDMKKQTPKSGSKKFSKINIDRFMMFVGRLLRREARVRW